MEPSTDPDAGHDHDDHDARRRARRRGRPTSRRPTPTSTPAETVAGDDVRSPSGTPADRNRPAHAHRPTSRGGPRWLDIALDPVDDVAFPDDEHITATGISNEKLGMWVYLASDCLLFGGLISTYLLYRTVRARSRAWRATSEKISDLFNIPFTSMTVVHPADELADDGPGRQLDHPQATSERMRLWLGATAVLGALFLGGQVVRVHRVRPNEGLGFTSNVSSSAFFTLTGFHGVHVLVGILMLLSALDHLDPSEGQGRGRRGARAVLALRRHRVGRDLHDRLPDPVTEPT